MSKLTKLYTLSTCSFLHANYTSIKPEEKQGRWTEKFFLWIYPCRILEVWIRVPVEVGSHGGRGYWEIEKKSRREIELEGTSGNFSPWCFAACINIQLGRKQHSKELASVSLLTDGPRSPIRASPEGDSVMPVMEASTVRLKKSGMSKDKGITQWTAHKIRLINTLSG